MKQRPTGEIEAADTMPAPAEAVPIVDDLEEARIGRIGRVEIVISAALRIGVITSIAIMFIGMAISFARHLDSVRDPQQLAALTTKEASFPHSLRDVASGVPSLRGQAIMALGLLILIATPVVRVVISIVAFAIQKDVTYLLITCTVLALLILSFLLGHAES